MCNIVELWLVYLWCTILPPVTHFLTGWVVECPYIYHDIWWMEGLGEDYYGWLVYSSGITFVEILYVLTNQVIRGIVQGGLVDWNHNICLFSVSLALPAYSLSSKIMRGKWSTHHMPIVLMHTIVYWLKSTAGYSQMNKHNLLTKQLL